MRTRNISKVVALLKELDVNVTTRWRNAQAQVMDSQQWTDDAELRQLAPLDMLLAFEDYSRVLERDYEEVYRKSQIERTRQERKAREGFRVSRPRLSVVTCQRLTIY
jgi:pre-mRNA-processing factor 40